MRKVALIILAFVLFAALSSPAAAQGPSENACWGQASQALAQLGLMGEHSNSFETPRLGLRNLARALYESGDLPDDTLQSLGAFVVTVEGFDVAACPELVLP